MFAHPGDGLIPTDLAVGGLVEHLYLGEPE
jgi:hypothetical protein